MDHLFESNQKWPKVRQRYRAVKMADSESLKSVWTKMTVYIRIRQTTIISVLFSVKNFGNFGRTTVVLTLKELLFLLKIGHFRPYTKITIFW